MEPIEEVGPSVWKKVSETQVEDAQSLTGKTKAQIRHEEIQERVRKLGERLTRLEAKESPKNEEEKYFLEEDISECKRELRKAKYVLRYIETGEAPIPDEDLTLDVLGRRRNEVDAALGQALEVAHRMDRLDDEQRRCIERVGGKICGRRGAYPWHYGWKCDDHSRMTQATQEASDFIIKGIEVPELTSNPEILAKAIVRTELILKTVKHPVTYGFYIGRRFTLENWFWALPGATRQELEDTLQKARKDHPLHAALEQGRPLDPTAS